MLNRSKARTEAVADQIEAARDDLGEALGREESHVEKMPAERPIAALGSAFALGGVVILPFRSFDQPRNAGQSEYRSALRFAEQLRRGFDHALALSEQPVTVAADEIDLMLAAFLERRL